MGKLFTPQDLNSGFNSNASLTANFEAIESAFDKTLSRTGESPNAMESPLDMNGQSIINVGSLLTSDLEVEGVSITDQVAQAEAAAAESSGYADDAEGFKNQAEAAVLTAEAYSDEAEGYAQDAENAYNNILYADIVSETGSFELTDSYTTKIVFLDSASGSTVTLDENAQLGTQAVVVQEGVGVILFEVEGSDNLLSFENLVNSSGPGSAITVIKISNGWYLGGNLA